jgi:hypothetical protein
MKRVFILSVFLIFSVISFSQGLGARSYLLAPKDVWGVNAKWLTMNQNFVPAGNIFIPGADISVNVFPTTLFHTFSLGGHFAQAYVMINPGSATAMALGVPTTLPTDKLEASGFSDGFVGFKIGLKNAPALSVKEFAESEMKFSVFGNLLVWYSGSYDENKIFNLGTNRLTFDIGLPMAVPLNKNKARATWLEIAPSVQIYTNNKSPARGGGSDQVKQAPLLILENHLTHNFNPKLWAMANLRFQQGGRTTVDGVKDDNNQSILGGGLGLGYQMLPFLGLTADYGGILAGDNNARSSMFRFSVLFVYANLNKK